MRIRTLVMAEDATALAAALGSQADGVVVSVADARRDPGELRRAGAGALEQAAAAGKAGLAIVNHPRTRILRDDIEALVGPGLTAVLLPHATEPQDVRDVAVLLREFELKREIEPGTVGVFPVIDSARGLVRAVEIAQAAPRVRGLAYDSAGYASDVGARDEEHGPRHAYARGAVIAAARAADGLPLVFSAGIDAIQLSHYGFAGIILPDTHGLLGAAATFTPTAAEVALAQRQLEAYHAAKAAGEWVARLDERVVDAHVARHAHRVLQQAGMEPSPSPGQGTGETE